MSEKDTNGVDTEDPAPYQLDDREESEPGRNGGGVLAAIGLLFSLAALVAVGYLFYQQSIQPPPYNARPDIKALQSQIQNVQAELSAGLSRVEQLARSDRADAAISELESEINARIAELDQQLGADSQDFLLAEIEYLLRMANQRVLMEKDPAGALALLKGADELLAAAEGLTMYRLREALANDIAALEAVRSIDTEGLYLRLSSLVRQVPSLTQARPEYTPDTPAVEPSDSADPGILQRAGQLALDAGRRLTTLVDYRRDMPQITPILPPAEEYYLRQNLILKLQMAQIALLEEEPEIYEQSLGESMDWIARYFDPTDSATTAMVSSLNEMKAVPIDRELPDVSSSLREARAVMQKATVE